MPDIIGLDKQRTKKLDMSEYFGTDAYITLKKLGRSVKKKLNLLQMDGALIKVARSLTEDGSLEDIQEMNPVELGKRYLDLPKEERAESNAIASEIEDLYLYEGIDSIEHNLTNNGEQIKLDVEFWEMFESAALYVISKIKEFNTTSPSLGEQKESNLIM